MADRSVQQQLWAHSWTPGLIPDYQRPICNDGVRSYRLAVRTLPFHGKDAGAIPAKSDFNSCQANR